MAAKGSVAKLFVENKIKEVFGEDFVGMADRKLYVWADDGGQKVQIAISLTCPKVGLDVDAPANNSFVQDSGIVGTYTGAPIVEMTAEEEQNIQTLIERLGL